MENKIDNLKTKKKKRTKNIVIVLIIVLVCIALIYRVSGWGSDPTFPIAQKIAFVVLSLIVLGFITGFAMLPKKVRIATASGVKVFFTHFVWPSMILMIILLGAMAGKYPTQYYPNGTFQENMNHSFSISAKAMTGAFQKLTMTFYDMGFRHPDFWMFFSIVFVFISIYLMKGAFKEDIYENMDAQELIDSITEKDYKDLEEWEKHEDYKKKHGSFKIFLHDLTDTKSKEFLKGWMFIIIALIVVGFGLWLWLT